MMGDLLEGFLLPNVSLPPTSIHPWNVYKSENIEALFEFAFVHLIDDGHLLLFVPEKKDVRDDVRTVVAYHDFVVWKDWWGFHKLLLCSPLDTSLTVHPTLYMHVML